MSGLFRHPGACLRLAFLFCLAASACRPADASPVRAERFESALLRGQAAMEDGLFDVAERQFTRAADLAADEDASIRAAAWLARALLARRRPQAAIDVVRERFGAAQSDVQAAELLYWLARAHHEAGDDTEAESVLDARLRMDPEAHPSPEILRLLGRVRMARGHTEAAAEVFRRFDELYGAMPEAPENRLDLADVLARGGDGERASALYREMIAAAPECPVAAEARLRLAELRLEAGDREGVYELTGPLCGGGDVPSGQQAAAWLLRARAARAEGDMAAAREAAQEAAGAGAGEDAWRAALLMVHLEIDEGRLDEAQRGLLDQMGARPGDAVAGRALLRLADAFRAAGRAGDGRDAFQRHIEIYGEASAGSAALRGKAWCLWDLAQYEEAAQTFQRFAERTSDAAAREEALYKVADAFFAAGRMADARDAYLAFAEGMPGSDRAGSAFLQAAAAMAAAEAWDEAAGLYDRVQDAMPDTDVAAEASLRRARLEERRGRWQDALVAYRHTRERFPEHAVRFRALLGSGLIRYRLGAIREALADFDAVLEGDPPPALREQGFFMRGWSLYLLGEEEDALAVCREFVERHPASTFTPDVLFWLGEHAFNRTDWAEAEEIFLRLATDFSGHDLADRALYWAGRAAAGSREFVRAIEHFSRLTREFPASPTLPEARFAQGDALSELGRFDDAILAYQEILRRFPDSYLVERATGRIGDCHFTLATDDARRYEDALRSYQAVIDTADAPLDLKLQAEYKVGRCLEGMDRVDEALERYMNAVYGHLEARRAGQMGSPVWFARAGFTAGSIQERQGRWREAVSIYRRVSEAGGGAADEARERIQRIRRENWRIY